MQEAKRSTRRNHALELKKAVLDECHAGASVASVAMAHGLNANLVHKCVGAHGACSSRR